MFNPSPVSSSERKWYWLAVLLLAYAYISHIAFYPINVGSDEGIRSLVALEMNFSGNYIVPTLNGEIYLNKPPLFNWILAASFKIFGYNAFALRLPTFLSIFIGGYIVFAFTRRYLNERTAWMAALLTMINGRILIYDSMLGLIDITYAWVTFLGFMIIFHFGEKKQYYKLFILSYLVAAAGYMLKGFPTFGYQGLTLLTWFIYTKNFKKLFHPAHFAGIFLFLVLIGSYYLLYFRLTNLSPEALFNNLFRESAHRTAFFNEIGKFFLHLISFPLSLFYHFAPPMIFFIVLIRKDWAALLKNNRYVLYCTLIFVANVSIYWLSPKIFARYLLTILPLLFIVIAYVYNEKTNGTDLRKKIVDNILMGSLVLMILGSVSLPFIPATKHVNDALLRSIFLFVTFSAILFWMIKQTRQRAVQFIIAVAIFRIGFNWFVIEQRGKQNVIAEKDGETIAAITKDQPLYIYGKPIDIYLGSIGDKNTPSFNIAKHRKEILRFNSTIDYNAFYLANPRDAAVLPHKVYYEFNNIETEKALLVKFLYENGQE